MTTDTKFTIDIGSATCFSGAPDFTAYKIGLVLVTLV